jgi:hypothetical protein
MHMLKTLLPDTPMNEFKGVCRCKNALGQEYKHNFWDKGPKEWNQRTDPNKIFTCSSSGVSICTLQLLWGQFLYFCTMYFCTSKASKPQCLPQIEQVRATHEHALPVSCSSSGVSICTFVLGKQVNRVPASIARCYTVTEQPG